MAKQINITIENNLLIESRDITVYHQFSKSAHMISNNSSVTLPLEPYYENDYLHISMVSGPGNLENKSVINLPAWVDFEFNSKGDVAIVHSGGRILVNIPPGFPTWQLRMTQSASLLSAPHSDRVTISDY